MHRAPKIAFPVLRPDLQVSFYHRVHALRNSYLQEAPAETVRNLDVSALDVALKAFVTRR